MSLPAYSSYKPVNAAWMGRVPTHWTVCSLAHRYEVALGKMLDEKRISGDHLAPYLRNVDVQWGAINTEGLPQMDFSGGDIARYSLRVGDLLVCEGGEVGRAAIWAGQLDECYYQKALHRLRPHSMQDNVRYFLYVLRAAAAQNIFSGEGGRATIAHLPAETLRRIAFPFPPIAEQERIAAFLDRETAKIDALVAEQEKLLALLAEKRQVTISHAVTRGLDPNVPVKDSGIAWLGEVPAHWNVSPLKYLVSLRSGGTPSKGRLDYWDGEIPWASAKDLKTETLADTTDHLTRMAVDSGAATLLPAGAILVVVRGMILARMFPVTQAMVPMAINQDLKGVLPTRGLDAGFLAWLLRGTAAESLQRLDEAGHGTKALRMDAWTSMTLPVPPEAEQLEIAAFLAERTAQLDALSGKAQSAIELLRERRSALIAAAVTGQIDVRGAAAC